MQSSNSNNAASNAFGLSHMLRRRRSGPNVGAQRPPSPPALAVAAVISPSQSLAATGHRIRLVPHLDSRRTLKFDAITRDLREGEPAVRIGRFTDRSGHGLGTINGPGSNKLAFKSKVVSRAHAEIWVEGGKFFIRDTKSSSGTFLNHSRLSPAGTESRQFQIRDGDILQLGVDYQGGAEDIYKSVKIRIEVGREWQASANAFNTSALKSLKSLAAAPLAPGAAKAAGRSSIPDCCICLFAVSIRQALFIAPCSHTFHYKCIRPLVESHHPAFCCPLCRTFADLEEDVEVEPPIGEGLDDDDDSAFEDIVQPLPATSTLHPRTIDRGAETEVEMDNHRPVDDVDMDAGPAGARAIQEEQDADDSGDNGFVDLGMADGIPGARGSRLSGGSGKIEPRVDGEDGEAQAGSKRKH